MIKSFSIIGLALASSIAVSATINGNWKIYPAFDNHPVSVIATPNKTYMLAMAQPYNANFAEYASKLIYLYAYDPEADEFLTYTTANYLSENIISSALYNPYKRYLLIAYANGNIDLLYDDNSIKNIPVLKLANLNSSKAINGIRFDGENGLVYLATDFGYLILDDNKGTTTQSRNYNRKLLSAERVGDKFIIVTDSGDAYWIKYNSSAFSLNDYQKIPDISGATQVFAINENTLGYTTESEFYLVKIDGDNFSTPERQQSGITTPVTYAQDGGYFLTLGGGGCLINNTGDSSPINWVNHDQNTANGSWNGKIVWNATGRKGLAQLSFENSKYTVLKDYMMPNVPSAFICTNIEHSDKYGILTVNHGTSNNFNGYSVNVPPLVSSLKNNEWNNLGYPYTNPDLNLTFNHPNGLTIDPHNSDRVLFGSFQYGILRMDLSDPNSMLIMSNATSAAKELPGFYQISPSSHSYCCFAAPKFDSNGNLWMYNMDFNNNKNITMYLWPAAAYKNNDTSKILSHIYTFNNSQSYSHSITPLKYSGHQNLIVLTSGEYNNVITILDTNGTPENFDDDKLYYKTASNYIDQDGNTISSNYANIIYEDRSTGICWLGAENGVYTFQPKDFIKNPGQLRRIKVARNDGTNLADYLLDNVPVRSITADNQGRKWFGTGGGGIIITSSDGREIIGDLTTSNSQIPSDNVYAITFNPENNSMLISTDKGYGEFFFTGAATDSSSAESDLKIYPNPVRPDYMGWINIEGAPDNGVVKVVDSAGNLVKELGPAEGGTTRWDGTNLEMKRVRSGVYHILTSSGPGDENLTIKGKVLIVN